MTREDRYVKGVRFPVIRNRNDRGVPSWIPWEIADLAYSVYSARYGDDQSMERLGQRGGFGVAELDEFVPGWRDKVEPINRLRAERDKAIEAERRSRSSFLMWREYVLAWAARKVRNGSWVHSDELLLALLVREGYVERDPVEGYRTSEPTEGEPA